MDCTPTEKVLCAALVVTNACWLAVFVYKGFFQEKRSPKMGTIARGVPLPAMAPVPGVFHTAGGAGQQPSGTNTAEDRDTEDSVRHRMGQKVEDS